MEGQEGNDVTIEHFISEHCAEESEIAKFFAGRRVFITGSTGFMGTVLIEKLLRSCPDIDKIYVLMRAKKGKSLDERFKEQFEGPIFERLRTERPGFQLKVYPLEGDCAKPRLGLSDDSVQTLKEVNVIFHVAATVRFDEKIRTATAINVQSSIDLTDIARTMPDLKAFVHVSTAYSYPQNKVIEEKFYEPDVTAERLINIVNNMSDEMLEAITPQLITSWPNTYAFTKAVGEAAVKKHGKGLPICMVRPSIVISTAKEPVAGWINNVYGPTGVVAGTGLGLIHVLQCDKDKLADMVPVDMAINNIVAAAWDLGTSWRGRGENEELRAGEEKDPEPPVLNYISSVDQPITWGEFMALNARGVEIPSVHCVWYYEFRLTKNPYLYLFQMCMMHLLPALLVDIGCRLVGKKPFLWDAYKKIHKFSKVITYFCVNDWRFRNDNVHRLWDKMNAMDRKVFDFNLENLRWEEYFRTYMRGLRVYLVHDPLETLPEARAKYAKLKIANYVLKGAIVALCVWFLLQILRWVLL